MTEHVDPHRFGQREEDHAPAGRAAQEGDPGRVGIPARAQDLPQRLGRADADGQQQKRDQEFDPFQHGRILSAADANCTDLRNTGKILSRRRPRRASTGIESLKLKTEN